MQQIKIYIESCPSRGGLLGRGRGSQGRLSGAISGSHALGPELLCHKKHGNGYKQFRYQYHGAFFPGTERGAPGTVAAVQRSNQPLKTYVDVLQPAILLGYPTAGGLNKLN